jgi:hypothetical protein
MEYTATRKATERPERMVFVMEYTSDENVWGGWTGANHRDERMRAGHTVALRNYSNTVFEVNASSP